MNVLALPTRLGTLGIMGGGQLGRMTVQAATSLGVDVVVAERFARSPAARVAAGEIVFGGEGGWDDEQALADLARQASTVTLENEFVDAGVLERLEALGVRVVPAPKAVAIVQDKLRQKRALARVGLPVAPFRPVDGPDELDSAAMDLGWPLMLKARRDGYDGYGNALVQSASEAVAACQRLGWPERSLYAEAVQRFERELAVIVVRGLDGEVVTYPVVETRQDPRLHVCRVVAAPAPLEEQIAREATRVARAAVETVGGTGTFGVELFLLRDGSVAINELAPRPHNSGHFSIEACTTSQFENHLRAVLGLPLGIPAMRAPAAAMVNLLGGSGETAPPRRERLAEALRVPEVWIHLYGKKESRPGRKMGHVTALGRTLDEAFSKAQRAAACLPV